MSAAGPGEPPTAEEVESLAQETAVMDKPVKGQGFQERPVSARHHGAPYAGAHPECRWYGVVT